MTDTPVVPARFGPFTREARAGAGACGEVWRVRHEDGTAYALKVLMNPGPYAETRFAREAAALFAVRHPNVVAVHKALKVGGRPALLLEWVDGVALEDAPLPSFSARMTLFEGILRGVATAHLVGVIHRDLKPSNVMVAGGVAKVSDFGLAKLVDAGVTLTRTGAMLGTLGWMSPEAFTQAERVDGRTDIFSLGCLLYWLLSGEMAFPSLSRTQVLRDVLEGNYRPLRELNPRVPAAMEATIAASLAPDPADRPPTCAAMWRGLGTV